MKRILLILLVSFMFSSCGGGGNGSSLPFYGGAWLANLRVVSNPCGFSFGAVTVLYNVNQMAQNVTVENVSTDVALDGVATDAGFAVGGRRIVTCPNGSQTTEENNIVFVISESDPDSAVVDAAIGFSCPSTGQCTVQWHGTAIRG